MKTNFWIAIFLAGIFIIGVSSCEKDNPASNGTNTFTNEEISEWIYEWMNNIYLWNDKIPGNINPSNEPNPLALFEKLLYREEDKWSFATDDTTSLFAELGGEPTSMGFSPAFGKFRSSNNVFIVVEYVIPETPAARAGLERGDIILTINGVELDTSNYRDLYWQDSFTAGLGTYTGETIIPSGESVNLTAEVITTRPVLHSEVIEFENKKIGYIVYVDFLSGKYGQFIPQLDTALLSMQEAGIDEFILDLRYNPGGEVGMASYLASSIAPSNIAIPSKVLVKYIFNNIITGVYLNEYGPNSPAFNLYFRNTNVNLDLNRLYVLTSSGTASASELVITGLDPYMDVVIVGDTTYGKYTGAWVFPDTETPARHSYAIVPIVLKYANSEGVTEFKNGLYPDYPMEDKLLGAAPLGSFEDPILAKTLELITGVNPAPPSKKSLEIRNYTIIPNHDIIRVKSINPDAMSMKEFPFYQQ